MADNNEDGQNNEHEGSQQQPKPKRQRLSDPDVKIIVQEKEFYMSSHVLASHSKFFDAAFSHDMKEKQKRQIILEDLEPDLFENAIKFLSDPVACRKMTTEDAVAVAGFYHKYDFGGGLQLCETILSQYFDDSEMSNDGIPSDLDLYVDVCVAATSYDFQSTKERLHYYLNDFLEGSYVQHGAELFSVDHITKLQPLFVKRLVFTDATKKLTEEELKSPLFPKYFVTHQMAIKIDPRVSNARFQAELKDAKAMHELDFSGTYRRHWLANRECEIFVATNAEVKKASRFANPTYFFAIMKTSCCDGDWAILAFTTNVESPSRLNDEALDARGEVLWRSPSSKHVEIPPHSPWVGVSRRVPKEGGPKLAFGCKF